MDSGHRGRSPRAIPDVERSLLFFGGKGGAGKTTLAAAASVRSADDGAVTLLVSTDPAHSAGDALGVGLSGEPRLVASGLWALEIDPEREVEAYIAEVRSRTAAVTPARLAGEVERQIDIARVSPGAQEAAVFERFCRLLHETSEFDRLVFDTAPTGHTLRLLTLPESMRHWISGLIDRRRKLTTLGRMWRNVAGAAGGRAPEAPDPVLDALEERAARFEGARRALTDPERTSFLFVLIPDRLPILETERAVTTLVRYGIPIGGLFVNQVRSGASASGSVGQRAGNESEWLAEIERRFDAWPIARVPLVDRAPVGVDELRRFSRHLAEPAVRRIE